MAKGHRDLKRRPTLTSHRKSKKLAMKKLQYKRTMNRKASVPSTSLLFEKIGNAVELLVQTKYSMTDATIPNCDENLGELYSEIKIEPPQMEDWNKSVKSEDDMLDYNIEFQNGSNNSPSTNHTNPKVDALNDADTNETNDNAPSTSISERKYKRRNSEGSNPSKVQRLNDQRETFGLTIKNDAFIQYLNLKLENTVNPEQKMYAEALIVKVLNKALCNRLTEFTDLTEIQNSNLSS